MDHLLVVGVALVEVGVGAIEALVVSLGLLVVLQDALNCGIVMESEVLLGHVLLCMVHLVDVVLVPLHHDILELAMVNLLGVQVHHNRQELLLSFITRVDEWVDVDNPLFTHEALQVDEHTNIEDDLDYVALPFSQVVEHNTIDLVSQEVLYGVGRSSRDEHEECTIHH